MVGYEKIYSMFKMGHEIFSNCAKFSSALVPRIKSDRSLREHKELSQSLSSVSGWLEYYRHWVFDFLFPSGVKGVCLYR